LFSPPTHLFRILLSHRRAVHIGFRKMADVADHYDGTESTS
jgi:hypothetical protein